MQRDPRWADRNFVLEHVKGNGRKLKHASDELRADPEIVLAAVKNAPRYALRYAGDKVKFDDTLTVAPVCNSNGDIDVEETLKQRSDYNLQYLAVTICGESLEYVHDKFRDDEFLVIRALLDGRGSFRFASERLKASKNFALKLINLNPMYISVLTPAMRDDDEVAAQAVRQNVRALRHISPRLSDDEWFLHQNVDHSAPWYAVNRLFSKRIQSLVTLDPGYIRDYAPGTTIKPAKQ